MSDDPRWWKLYREERSKIAPGKHGWKQALSAQQIAHAARGASRRFRDPGEESPDSGVREPRPRTDPPSLSAAAQADGSTDDID